MPRPLTKILRLWMKGDLAKIAQVKRFDEAGSTTLPSREESAHDLIRFLKSQGFTEDRQSGSHLTIRHAERKVSVTLPTHGGCDLGRGLAVPIPKDAGFAVEDFLHLR